MIEDASRRCAMLPPLPRCGFEMSGTIRIRDGEKTFYVQSDLQIYVTLAQATRGTHAESPWSGNNQSR